MTTRLIYPRLKVGGFVSEERPVQKQNKTKQKNPPDENLESLQRIVWPYHSEVIVKHLNALPLIVSQPFRESVLTKKRWKEANET